MRPFTLNLCNSDEEFVLLSSLIKSTQTSTRSAYNDSCIGQVCGCSDKLRHNYAIADNLCYVFEKSISEQQQNNNCPLTLHLSDEEFDLLHSLIKSACDSAFSVYEELRNSSDFEKSEKSQINRHIISIDL